MSPGERRNRDFAERVAPHQAVLLRFLRRFLNDPGEAADVLQSALARALEAHERFDPDASFRSWIYRFVTFEALNANRGRARAGAPLAPPEPPADPCSELEAEIAHDELVRDPDAALARLDEPLAEGLRGLAPAERAALLLRSLADLSCAEIAAILEAPKGTVMSWLFRARCRLRERLAGYARARGWRGARPAEGSR